MKKFLIFALLLFILYLICTAQDVQSQQEPKQETTSTWDVVKTEIIEEKKEETLIIYKTIFETTDPRQAIINYAYTKGWLDFLLTLDWENWQWTTGRRSNIIWANWYWDFGICQLNYKYHKDFINSDNFKDPYKQIDYCLEVWQDAIKKWRLKTTFYAYKNRMANKVRFENLK